MKSKISDNKCHSIDMNNENDKIQESAPSGLRYTATNKNKNISKNEIGKKIISDNINNSMANYINSKITVITRETVSIIMRATATVATIKLAVAKKTTSTVVTSTAR